MSQDHEMEDMQLQLVEELDNKNQEIKTKIEQWEKLSIKIDQVLEKIRQRKANKE